MNAYRKARKINPGCQHLLGCKCEPPYWLRESTQAETEIECALSQKPREIEHRKEPK